MTALGTHAVTELQVFKAQLVPAERMEMLFDPALTGY